MHVKCNTNQPCEVRQTHHCCIRSPRHYHCFCRCRYLASVAATCKWPSKHRRHRWSAICATAASKSLATGQSCSSSAPHCIKCSVMRRTFKSNDVSCSAPRPSPVQRDGGGGGGSKQLRMIIAPVSLGCSQHREKMTVGGGETETPAASAHFKTCTI